MSDLINALNFEQTSKLISAIGKTNTVVAMGSPGIGKSSLLKQVAKDTGLKPVYIDAPVTDLSLLAMPTIENKRTYSALHEQWQPEIPSVYMLDEVFKARGPSLLMFTRFMLERNICGFDIHPNSIVIGTSNLTTDGVGDSTQGHVNNRVTRVIMRNPTTDEWITWALQNDIDPIIMAWVDQNPHSLASYLEKGQENNPYNFNPKQQSAGFVSPRSLEKASHIVKHRDKLGIEITRAGLVGTVGASAGMDMNAYFTLKDQLPKLDTIAKNPKEASMPSNIAAQLMLVFSMVTAVSKQTFDAHFEYMQKFPLEIQSVWARSLNKMPEKFNIAVMSPQFNQWARNNMSMLAVN